MFRLYTEISNGAVNFRMAKQQLNSAQVSSTAVYFRGLSSMGESGAQTCRSPR